MDDLPALLRFYRSLSPLVVRAYRPYGYDVTEAALRDGPFKRLAEGDEYAFVIADAADEIFGHAFLSRVRSQEAHFGIGVHQSLLGRGWGRRLMGALMEGSERDLALRSIDLRVLKDNGAANRLYESFGFERTGELTDAADGLEYYLMVKRCAAT
mgnify:FL=1